MVRGAVCDVSRTLYAYTSERISARFYIFSDEEIYLWSTCIFVTSNKECLCIKCCDIRFCHNHNSK